MLTAFGWRDTFLYLGIGYFVGTMFGSSAIVGPVEDAAGSGSKEHILHVVYAARDDVRNNAVVIVKLVEAFSKTSGGRMGSDAFSIRRCRCCIRPGGAANCPM